MARYIPCYYSAYPEAHTLLNLLGSFLEFLPILSILSKRFAPSTLPYHVIVPSLPGYAFSSSPPLNADFNIEHVAHLMDQLAVGLGFQQYFVQGGDWGARVARIMGATYPNCKGDNVAKCNIY
jgi:microsomal epoxide hydrolase